MCDNRNRLVQNSRSRRLSRKRSPHRLREHRQQTSQNRYDCGFDQEESVPTKSVSFHDVEVIELPFELGDSPAISAGGPPLTIGWSALRRTTVAVPVFEQLRRRKCPRDTRRALLISKSNRERILKQAGYTTEEMDRVTLEVKRLRRLRMLSQIDKDDRRSYYGGGGGSGGDDLSLSHVSIHASSSFSDDELSVNDLENDRMRDRQRRSQQRQQSDRPTMPGYRDGYHSLSSIETFMSPPRAMTASSSQRSPTVAHDDFSRSNHYSPFYHLTNRFDRIKMTSDSGLVRQPRRLSSPGSPNMRKVTVPRPKPFRSRSHDELMIQPVRRCSPPPLQLRRKLMDTIHKQSHGRRNVAIDASDNRSTQLASGLGSVQLPDIISPDVPSRATVHPSMTRGGGAAAAAPERDDARNDESDAGDAASKDADATAHGGFISSADHHRGSRDNTCNTNDGDDDDDVVSLDDDSEHSEALNDASEYCESNADAVVVTDDHVMDNRLDDYYNDGHDGDASTVSNSDSDISIYDHFDVDGDDENYDDDDDDGHRHGHHHHTNMNSHHFRFMSGNEHANQANRNTAATRVTAYRLKSNPMVQQFKKITKAIRNRSSGNDQPVMPKRPGLSRDIPVRHIQRLPCYPDDLSHSISRSSQLPPLPRHKGHKRHDQPHLPPPPPPLSPPMYTCP